MKIKITLITFFASALLLTSCMKNEVSPGIEQVRTAYAAFLNAKAQAEVILANAKAAWDNAQAAVLLAQAAATNQATAEANAKLEIALMELQLVYETNVLNHQKLVDAYASYLRDSANNLVRDYFTKYNTAMGNLAIAQGNYNAKLVTIVKMQLDLAVDSTVDVAHKEAALANLQAELARLNAEMDIAVANVGDTVAIREKMDLLLADTSAFNAQILQHRIEQALIENDADAELAAWTAATVPSVTSYYTAWYNKDSICTNFERDFLNDTMKYDSIPEFWGDALHLLDSTSTDLTTGANDTLFSYNAMKAAQNIIAAGTTVIDAEIADTLQAISDYNDSIALYTTDSTTTYATFQTDSALSASLRVDTAAWAVIVELRHDSAVAQRDRGALALAAISEADSSLYASKIIVAELVDIPAADADSSLSWAAYVIADNALTTARNTFVPKIAAATTELGSSTTTVLNAAGTLYEQKNQILKDVADATAALPDLISDYLYWQTFMPELIAAKAAAVANKEALRPDYEAWRDTYMAAQKLIACDAATAAWTTYQTKLAAQTAAQDAKDDLWDVYQAARLPYLQLDTAIMELQADLAFTRNLYNAYKNAIDFGTGIVDGIQALIDAKILNIETAEKNLELALYAMEHGEMNIEAANEQLANLSALVDAAQAEVDFWKALLDEAIAAANAL